MKKYMIYQSENHIGMIPLKGNEKLEETPMRYKIVEITREREQAIFDIFQDSPSIFKKILLEELSNGFTNYSN
ncbi:MAG TPA: hypothetical protein PLP73_01190 [Candidatus Absconditabacterales bacterium]|nr:hypothetical protein [Candidatus Absconditabacterales bacterium]